LQCSQGGFIVILEISWELWKTMAVACDYNKLKSFDVTLEITTLCCVHVFTYHSK